MEANYEELADSIFRKLESIDGRDWTGQQNVYQTTLKGKKHDFTAYSQRRVDKNDCCHGHMFSYELFVLSPEKCILHHTGDRAEGLFKTIEKKMSEATYLKASTENKEIVDDFMDFVNS